MLLCVTTVSFSQKVQWQIHTAPGKLQGQSSLNARTQSEIDTLFLPFWDDFSASGPTPDTAKWLNSDNVLINPSLGINPPTLNIATFDGVTGDGNTFSLNPTAFGETDVLLSLPIDLTEVDPAIQNTIFFSFFWQRRGVGENPDATDSIRLQFLDTEMEWITVWSEVGGQAGTMQNFEQVIFQVDPNQFIHDAFQFRYQSFGNQSGLFDTWHIDYVFCASRRNINDISFLDAAVSTPQTSIFGDFTAIPIRQLREFNSLTLPETAVDVFNLSFDNGEQLDLIGFLREQGSTDTLVIYDPEVDSGDPFTRNDGVITEEVNAAQLDVLDLSVDSLILESVVTLNAAENPFAQIIDGNTVFFDEIDFNLNNQTVQTIPIDNFFAYDDGTAELIGIARPIFAEIMVEFVLSTNDVIQAVDIYFPPTAESRPGQPIDVVVRASDNGLPGIELSRQSFTTLPVDSVNQFGRYIIPQAFVEDTIFVGFQILAESGTVAVGLDLSADNTDLIFENTTGSFVPTSLGFGTLMLRPIFQRDSEREVVTGIVDELGNEPVLYPNPSNGIFQIDARLDEVNVFNALGQKIIPNITRDSFNTRIDLSGFPPGIYFIQAQQGNQFQTFRGVVR